MNTVQERKQALIDAILDLCWSQWTVIGVAGTRESQSYVVDPEALVLLTSSYAQQHDARLFDEMLDWLVTNERRMDLSRLRRMTGGKSKGEPKKDHAGAVISYVNDNVSNPSWETLTAHALVGREAPVLYTPELRGMSRSPNAAKPAALRFRARALTGIGVKAEVLTYLWTHEWSHGRGIYGRISYGATSVAEYLSELAQAGLLDSRTEGKRVLYRAAEELASVGRPAAVWVDWTRFSKGMIDLLASLDAISEVDELDTSHWMELAAGLEHGSRAVAAEGIDRHMPSLRGWVDRGTDSLLQMFDDIVGVVEGLAAEEG